MSINLNIIITFLTIIVYSYSLNTSEVVESIIPSYQSSNKIGELAIDSTIFLAPHKPTINTNEDSNQQFIYKRSISTNNFDILRPQIPRSRTISNKNTPEYNVNNKKSIQSRPGLTEVLCSPKNSDSLAQYRSPAYSTFDLNTSTDTPEYVVGNKKFTKSKTGLTKILCSRQNSKCLEEYRSPTCSIVDFTDPIDASNYVVGGKKITKSKTTLNEMPYNINNNEHFHKTSHSFDQSRKVTSTVLQKIENLNTTDEIKAHKKTLARTILENGDTDKLAEMLSNVIATKITEQINGHKDLEKKTTTLVQVLEQACDKIESHVILSIDGGGIKGKVPCKILDSLIKQGIDLRSECDIIAGTSIGGILAVLLLLQDNNGTYLYTPKSLDALIKDNSKKIFNKRFKFSTGFGLFGSKYKNDKLKEFLQNHISKNPGNVIKKLSDIRKKTKKRLIIPAYDMSSQKTYIFDSDNKNIDFNLVDICMATSAAPIYFPTYAFRSISRSTNTNTTHFNCIDGGIFLNFPASAAIMKTIYSNTTAKPDIFLISISTGYTNKKTISNQPKNWGIFGWLKNKILNLILNSATSFSEDILSNALGEKFIRIEVPLKKASTHMDDISLKNLKNLDRDIEEFINGDLFHSQIEIMKKEFHSRSYTCSSIDYDESLYNDSANYDYNTSYNNESLNENVSLANI